MYYLDHKTLEFFIYSLFTKESYGIRLDQFNPKLVDIVLQDIKYNKLNRYFIYMTFLDLKTQSGKIDEIDYLIKRSNRSMEPFYSDFTKVTKTLDIIRNGEVGSCIGFNMLEAVRERGYLSPSIYQFLVIYLFKSKKKELTRFLKNYINSFLINKLEYRDQANFYDFEENLNRFIEVFDLYYKKYGKNFNINRLVTKERKSFLLEGDLRLYEIILHLLFDDHITIKNSNFFKINNESILREEKTDCCILNVNVIFKRRPSEIQKSKEAWLVFKDLRLNQHTGEAIYKDNEPKTFGLHTKKFKLLYHLMKNTKDKPKEFDLYMVYDALYPEKKSDDKSTKRYLLQIDVKDIKKVLGITKDKNRTVDINFSKNAYIILN